jgi:hypothetical protein
MMDCAKGNGVAGQPTAEVINMRHPRTNEIRRGVDLHLIPTKCRCIINGKPTRYTYQGHCVKCWKKAMNVCSGCEDDPDHPHDTFI